MLYSKAIVESVSLLVTSCVAYFGRSLVEEERFSSSSSKSNTSSASLILVFLIAFSNGTGLLSGEVSVAGL